MRLRPRYHHPARQSRHRGGAVAAGRVGGGRYPGESGGDPVTGRARRPIRCRSRGRARRDGVPRRHHHRRTAHRGAGQYTDKTDWETLTRPARSTHRRPGTAGRRLLPGHLDLQHHPRLEPRQPVRAAHPDGWNGGPGGDRGAGQPQAVRSDFLISDFVLAQGFAYASTDKGNNSPDFYRDGTQPGDAVAEWHERVTQLAVAAKVPCASATATSRTAPTWPASATAATCALAAGEPAGALRRRGRWEGTLLTPDGPNLFTYLPTAVRYTLGLATAEDMYAAGFAHGSESAVAVPPELLLGADPEDLPGGVRPGVRPGLPGATAATTGDLSCSRARATRATTPGSPTRRHSRCTTPWRGSA